MEEMILSLSLEMIQTEASEETKPKLKCVQPKGNGAHQPDSIP